MVAASVVGVGQADARGGVDDVIPLPRQIRKLDGVMRLSKAKALRIELAEAGRPRFAAGVRQLCADLKALRVPPRRGDGANGAVLHVGRPTGDGSFAQLCRKHGAMPDPNWGPDGYRLRIAPTLAIIAGNGDSGCFYGLQTVRQMLEPGKDGQGALLQCVDVCDWPAMTWRGTMFGLQSPDEHARLAFYKMNLFNWEVNQVPDYQTIPEFAGGTPLSHYRDVAASAERLFVRMTLETQSFGHVHWMLDKFPDLRALADKTHVLRPLSEPTYALIGRIYSELCPLYATPIYHAGCDEAWGIEAWAEGQKMNTAEVVGRHIQRLADMLAKQGKRTMIWGDYLLKHREAVKWMRPEDYMVCDWHYEPAKEYDRVDFFVKRGFETLVSPSVVPARPIFPDYERQIPNIRVFIQDGVKRGAIGLLNTNWPVSPMPTECYWYGWICGAEYAWNPTGRSQDAFDRVFFRRAYGLSAEQGLDLFGKFGRLGAYHQLDRQTARPPADKLREFVHAGGQLVVARLPSIDTSDLANAQKGLNAAAKAASPAGARRLKTFQQILDRLVPSSEYLANSQALGLAVAQAIRTAMDGGSDARAAAVGGVRRCAADWLKLLGASPGMSRRAEALALGRSIMAITDPSVGSPAARVERLITAVGVKPASPSKTVPIKPGTCFSVLSDPAKIPPPRARREGWCCFPRREGAVRWTSEFRRSGRYRLIALLRHSAGVWENDKFVRGGRNAAYVGRYGWKLDGKPLKEQWIGKELNPDADEAFQWAVLADQNFKAGTHTLTAHVTGINHAIVAEFVFTQDSDFTPGTKRSDIKME